MLVYAYRNRITGKVYIGKTTLPLVERHKHHLKRVRQGSQTHFHNALRKYGVDGFELFQLAGASSVEELNALEQRYIQEFRAHERERGYNGTLGGTGGVPIQDVRDKIGISKLGQKHSEETRKKLREARKKHPGSPAKGKKWSAESREKARLSHLGKPSGMLGKNHSLEQRAKWSVERKGKRKSLKMRQRLSASRTGKKYPRVVCTGI